MSALSRDGWPSSVRSDSRLAAAVGYGLALVAFGLTIGGDFGTSVDLAGAIAVTTVLAVPPTLALMADPRRPLLLLPAALIAVSSFPLSIIALPMVWSGLVWFWVYSKVAPRGRVVRKLTVTLLVWVLWVPALAALFVHADPRCTWETGATGSRPTLSTFEGLGPYAASRNASFTPATASSLSRSGTRQVLIECTSDIVVWWEALVAFSLSSGAVLTGWFLTMPSGSEVPVLIREPIDPTPG